MASLAAERLQSPIHSTGLWGPSAALQPYLLLRAVGTPPMLFCPLPSAQQGVGQGIGRCVGLCLVLTHQAGGAAL